MRFTVALCWLAAGAVAAAAQAASTDPAYPSRPIRMAVPTSPGGKLAQVGARLIDGVAKQLAGKFFETFNQRAGRG